VFFFFFLMTTQLQNISLTTTVIENRKHFWSKA